MADDDVETVLNNQKHKKPVITASSAMGKRRSMSEARMGLNTGPRRYMRDCFDSCRNPHSQINLGWDCLGLLLTVYDLVSIPIEIAWDLPTESRGTPTPVALVLFEIVFWSLDMALSFFRGFFSNGVVVLNMRMITRKYLRGWFGLDLLLIVVDCLIVFSRSWNITGLVRLTTWIRMIRMTRIYKMMRTAKVLEEACITWRLPSASLAHAVIYSFAMILLLTHMVACAWYLIGRRGRTAGHDNWLDAYGISSTDMEVEYLLSFHWVMAQFTPAPASIHPATPEERFFTIIVIFFTLFVLGKGYQKMSQTIQELNASRQAKNVARRQIQQFLALHKVPLDLAMRTNRFADHVLARRARVELDPTLVSEHLRQELTTHQRQAYLLEHPLFELFLMGNPDVLCHVCEALQHHSYDKGQAIFASGSLARCMYISSQGAFELETDMTYENYTTIAYFSEVSLYATFMHASTLRATTFCDAFTLHAADFKLSVVHDPGCSRLVLEYAASLLNQLRKNGAVYDVLPSDLVLQAVKATKYFRLLSAETNHSFVAGPHMSLDRIGSEASSQPGHQPSNGGRDGIGNSLRDFLLRLKDGEIDVSTLPSECERVIPEVDGELGVYAKLDYQDERVRTMVSIVNTLWLWNDNYSLFTAPQPSDAKISPQLWRKLQLFTRWAAMDDSVDMIHASIVMIAIRGIGNIPPIVKELPKSHQRTSAAVAHILHDHNHVFMQHIPSAQALSEETRKLVADAFIIHDKFNLGQFMEGENLPYNLQQLQEVIKSRPNGDKLLRLYLLAVVGVLSGRDIRKSFELDHAQVALGGSSFIDDHRARLMMACIEVLEHILLASPVAIYWSYMTVHAKGLPLTTPGELALARLMCLSRSHTTADMHQMFNAWENLQEVDRALVTDCLLADGIVQRSVRFVYLPMCFANARGNPCVQIGKLLKILAELLELVKAHGCWGQTEAMTLMLDLKDLASFIVSVNNAEVFETCLLRAELKQSDSRIDVHMTSRNWLRATDTDNHEVVVFASLHTVLQRQRAMEYVLEGLQHYKPEPAEVRSKTPRKVADQQHKGSLGGRDGCQVHRVHLEMSV